jgi:diguanylate cyclase (GGDEF)-like protein
MATTDFLTGLANRRSFMARLEAELARLKRFDIERAAILMLDLDHFKRVNDSHGHAAGDAVLKHFAALLRAELRKIDTGGRLGGEEFAILLIGADLAAAELSAERLRRRIAATPLDFAGQSIAVTVSIGIATLAPGDASADAALRRADAALYAAKQAGRNRVCASPDPTPEAP